MTYHVVRALNTCLSPFLKSNNHLNLINECFFLLFWTGDISTYAKFIFFKDTMYVYGMLERERHKNMCLNEHCVYKVEGGKGGGR